MPTTLECVVALVTQLSMQQKALRSFPRLNFSLRLKLGGSSHNFHLFGCLRESHVLFLLHITRENIPVPLFNEF